MKSIEIYFFSGTGNAKRIALWINHQAQKHLIPCHLHNIAHIKFKSFEVPEKGSSIFIISPIHGFNFPKITLDFIRNFPKGSNQVVLMNTRGGMKIGNWVTPGLTGIAFFLSSLWLKIKGYTIQRQIPYDMPSNWISLHPAIRPKASGFIHEVIKNRVEKHCEMLFRGNNLFISRREIIQDVLIAPISFLYYFFGRFFLAKTFYASHHCDNCGICIKDCPVDAIVEVNGRPFWTHKCENCMHCMNNCPQNAIEVSNVLGIVSFLVYSIVTAIIFRFLSFDFQLGVIAKFLVTNLIFFLILYFLYYIQHQILRNNFIAKLIAHSSLTFYKFWGRYKSMVTKDKKK